MSNSIGVPDERPDDSSFERALAAARPTAPELGRRLRLHGVLAAVLGVERPLPALDRYALEQQIGAGGMGVVYRGRELASGRAVAVKLIDSRARFERARFEREVRVLRELASPRIVGYLDHGRTADGQDYLVMEWVDGEDLLARLRRGPLDVARALRLGIELARALATVHAAGITHRDVKPSNVILVGDRVDDVRLIDFGIAHAPTQGPRLTATGAMLGTPSYMAPEQIEGHADARTDVYGLGATLFEALTGRPVFAGEHPGAIVLAVLAEAPPSVSALRPDVPGAVDALVGRMLAKRPADRPVDMDAVAIELAQLADDLAGRDGPAVLSRAERSFGGDVATLPADPGGTLGRDRPLAQIAGILAEAAAEESTALVAITGEAGLGKSRLLDEVVAGAGAWTCLHARALKDERGVPFAVVRSLVAAHPASGPTALAELLGAPDRTADPVVFGDRVVLAWLQHLEALSAARPLLLAVDDVDHADPPSQRLLDRALAHLAGRAFAVITTGSGAAGPLGARLPADRITRLTLPPLGPRAAARLAARWAPSAAADDRARAVAIAAGNPMHLRALCQTIVHDRAALETRSVAELIWSRFAALPPELRRTLRAASIVGRELWLAAVATLLGVPVDDPAFLRGIETLVAEHYLRASARSRIPGQRQLEFTSELAFLAAYELSGDDDRRIGHRAVARWLAAHAPDDDALRAHHLDGAGLRDEAARHHLAAAYTALAGGDGALVDACLARARSPDAPAEIAGEAHALDAQARFWRGRTREALEAGERAIAHLGRGTAMWFDAASHAITAAGQLGDHAALWRIVRQVMATEPDGAASAEARVVAAYRAISQLAGTAEPDGELRDFVDAVELERLGPEARAWFHRVQAHDGARRGFDTLIDAIVHAHRAHVELEDPRSAALMAIHLCSAYVWSGAWERARAAIEDALRIVRSLEIDYLELWGAYARAKLLVETAAFAESSAALARVIDGASASPRIRAGAHVYTAIAATRAEAHARAIEAARTARATHAAPVVALAGAAAEVRSLLSLGRIDEAATLAPALEAHARGAERLPEWDELVRLAWAELALARGEAEPARRALASASAMIRARAETLSDPLRRNEYLARPHLVARTLTLAARAP